MANTLTFRGDRTQVDPYDDAKFNSDDSNEIVTKYNAAVTEINANNAKRTYPSADETKLGTIDADADVNPTQASGGEITAGTETAVRGHSPADIKSYIGQHESAETPPVHLTYSTTALMITGQGSQKTGWLYYVTGTKTYYEYLGTTVGNLTDYRGGGMYEDKWKIHLAPLDTVPSNGLITGLALTADVDYTLVDFFLETFDAGTGVDVDVLIDTVTIFSTRITIDSGEKNTIDPATPYVTTNLTWDQGEVMTFNIIANGGAKTPILTFKTTRID